MLRIDAHQHFWQFNPVRDSWITDEMAVIQKDFLPAQLAPVLQQHGFDGCIAVQADQSEAQNEWLLSLAAQSPLIRGIVGWVNLQSPDIRGRLDHYRQYPLVKGFRHVLQGEADRALHLKPAFKNGIRALQDYGYTYDLLIFPDQLGYTAELVADFPDQLFVVDHIAKPPIRQQQTAGWEAGIRALAAFPNVYCKVSGMVTEADWRHWTPAHFTPYLDVVTEAFGTDRLLYGSDWPVCLVAGGYSRMLEIVKAYYAAYPKEVQDGLFGGNAARFYGLTR